MRAGPWRKVSGMSVRRWLTLILDVLTMVILFRIGRRVAEQAVALLAAVFYSFSPYCGDRISRSTPQGFGSSASLVLIVKPIKVTRQTESDSKAGKMRAHGYK